MEDLWSESHTFQNKKTKKPPNIDFYFWGLLTNVQNGNPYLCEK